MFQPGQRPLNAMSAYRFSRLLTFRSSANRGPQPSAAGLGMVPGRMGKGTELVTSRP